MQATLTFLGTGTSMGIPTLGCPCAVCASARIPGSPNRRTRPSISLAYNARTVLVDTGPDFHAQALREGISHVDAVLYTHGHADHILGMDDLRPLTFQLPHDLPLYADSPTADTLERIFAYTFQPEKRHSTSARVALNRITHDTPIPLFGATFQPIPLLHGRLRTTGYRFGAAAYLTDMSDLPPESLPLLQNLDVLILDALRLTPHFSHSHLAKSVAFVDLLQPKRAFFTHMGHDLDHDATNAALPPTSASPSTANNWTSRSPDAPNSLCSSSLSFPKGIRVVLPSHRTRVPHLHDSLIVVRVGSTASN